MKFPGSSCIQLHSLLERLGLSCVFGMEVGIGIFWKVTYRNTYEIVDQNARLGV
jgi:hypothetical protein